MEVIANFEDISGLFYIEDYLSEEKINEVKKYLNKLDFSAISNATNSRRVAHFGYYYSYDRTGLTCAPTIPDFLNVLVDDVEITGKGFIEFDQVIINEYKPGQGIAPHTDHTKLFGPIIACITIGSSVPITFRNGNITKKLEIKEGSMYIMTKDSRYKWTHSLTNKSKDVRYSITYRAIQKN